MPDLAAKLRCRAARGLHSAAVGHIPGYGLIRSILRGGSDAEIAQAVDYARKIKLYPLSQVGDPPETAWVDASSQRFDAAIPYDIRFFQALHKIIQEEPFLHRDRVMIDQLSSLGIEAGKAFDPNSATEQILTDAIHKARAWLDLEYEAVFHPFAEGARWALPANPDLAQAIEANFEQPNAYPVLARAVVYSFAFFSSKHLGKGQFYLMTIVDREGAPLDGAMNYRLNVRANAPVTQYWSATAYNRNTHTLITDVKCAGRSSQSPGLKTNADGSVDIYFGPTPLAGRESNWIPTDPQGRFEVLFRSYGPTPALFDRSWKLTDIEQIPP
jgi:hypothetical protein